MLVARSERKYMAAVEACVCPIPVVSSYISVSHFSGLGVLATSTSTIGMFSEIGKSGCSTVAGETVSRCKKLLVRWQAPLRTVVVLAVSRWIASLSRGIPQAWVS